jgi:competence protein ComEA
MSASPQPERRRSVARASVWALVWVLGALLVGGLIALYLQRPQPAPIAVQPPPTPQPTPTPRPVTVYVSGAVVNPGLYTLPMGARIRHALDEAGGLAADAYVDGLNLAEILYDGARVHVPTVAESASGAADGPVAGFSGDGGRTTLIDVQGAPVGGGIDINTASQDELEELPGIGPAKAQAIIANRPYDSVDDLDRVPGIGPATLEELRPLVTVSRP